MDTMGDDQTNGNRMQKAADTAKEGQYARTLCQITRTHRMYHIIDEGREEAETAMTPVSTDVGQDQIHQQ